MPQSSSQEPVTASDRWSTDQTLSFLRLLLKAKSERLWHPKKATPPREAFRNILAQIKRRHPERAWQLRSLENKYSVCKKKWVVFKDAKNLPGTTYDTNTGRLMMSSENEDTVIKRHREYGRGIVYRGLLVGNGVTIETWQEIFQSSRPPVGRYISETSDAEGRLRAEVLAGARARARARSRGLPEDSVITESLVGETNGLPVFPTRVDEEEEEEEQPPPPPPPLPAPPRRSSGTLGSPSRRAVSIMLGDKERVAAFLGILHRLKDAISECSAPQPREHIIQEQVEGAEDFKKALRTCFALTEKRGMVLVNRIINWLRQDPLNVLIWNSLPSDKIRNEWIAINFKENS